MWYLLNPKVWIAAVLVVVLAGTHFSAYRSGRSHVLAAWNKEKAELTAKAFDAERAARTKEQALVVQRQQAEKRYVEEKRKAATAALASQSALDSLRHALDERDRAIAAADSATSARANGGARLERDLLGSCATALTELGAEADRLEARIVGLQSYVKQVCLKQQTP
jgi:hypothetical protein